MAKVLVVDDSYIIRDSIAKFLGEQGIEALTACDGMDAINKVKENQDIKLIISDFNMPIMDGLTMAERIQDEIKARGINVVMLTTENNSDLKNRGRALGVKGWIVKPFNGLAVINVLKTLIGT